MILADVNVLLYAFRRDAERHDDYRSWLERVVNGETAYGTSPQVLASVIRIGTHRRIYVHPSTTSEALAFCDAPLQPGNCAVVQPGPPLGHLHEPLSQVSRDGKPGAGCMACCTGH
jgi:predicted nucleic acid-binding protein